MRLLFHARGKCDLGYDEAGKRVKGQAKRRRTAARTAGGGIHGVDQPTRHVGDWCCVPGVRSIEPELVWIEALIDEGRQRRSLTLSQPRRSHVEDL